MEKEINGVIEAPHTVAQIVKNSNAEFSHYKEGKLFYTVIVEGYRYEFPIELIQKKNVVKSFDVIINDIQHQIEIQLDNVMSLSEDIGESSFEGTYKAITLMRYIRKAIADGSLRWDKIV